MTEHVYCLGCGGEFDADTDPYPLSNGMCAKCRREARRPVASILAENERLQAEVDRLHGEKDEAQRQEHMAKNAEAQLRRALERIADDDCGTWDQAMRYVRRVLDA